MTPEKPDPFAAGPVDPIPLVPIIRPETPEDVVWETRAPDPTPQFIRILRPKAKEDGSKVSVRAILLGDAWVSAWVHFYRKLSVVCTKPRCTPCDAANEARRKYWMCGQELEHGRKVSVEFTPIAFAALQNQIRKRSDWEKGARGILVILARAGHRNNSRVAVSIDEKRHLPLTLHQPFDLKEAVTRCFRMEDSD